MCRKCRNGALSKLCDFLDFGRCVEFILKLKDGSKQDLREYRILSLVHPPTNNSYYEKYLVQISKTDRTTTELLPRLSSSF